VDTEQKAESSMCSLPAAPAGKHGTGSLAMPQLWAVHTPYLVLWFSAHRDRLPLWRPI
jgi:hypothetical protein